MCVSDTIIVMLVLQTLSPSVFFLLNRLLPVVTATFFKAQHRLHLCKVLLAVISDLIHIHGNQYKCIHHLLLDVTCCTYMGRMLWSTMKMLKMNQFATQV